MSIFRLESANVSAIWGGDALARDWGKICGGDNIAESWVMSARADHPSAVEETGTSFLDFIGKNPDFLGKKAKNLSDFPILVKLIDAKNDLSVQVHPDDEYARTHENQLGKNEMWYVLDAVEGGGVYCGFKDGINKTDVRSSIANGELEKLLNFIPVKKGDCIFIPAGTVHAIRGGLLIFEIQQNSGVTYRLFDYNRRDKFGKTRELHIEKSLDVLKLAKSELTKGARTGAETRLADCRYFKLVKVETDGEYDFEVGDESFAGITVIEGKGGITCGENSVDAVKGDTFFIPAGAGTVKAEGKLTFMRYGV